MKITEPDKIKVGMWASQSCHRDLHKITDPDEIKLIIADWEDGIDYDVWETRKEALSDIRKTFSDEENLRVIDKMLKEDIT